jgi:hypothetical protein
MPLSREPFFLRMAIWLRGLERWYLVLGGVAVGPRVRAPVWPGTFSKMLIGQKEKTWTENYDRGGGQGRPGEDSPLHDHNRAEDMIAMQLLVGKNYLSSL